MGGGLYLVGIGGHGCAGKTTLARRLVGAQLVHTEEFWDGRDFDVGRLRREVLAALRRGEAARYRAFDWESQQALAEPRLVRPHGVVVVEGVCALHRTLRDAYDLRIWVEAPRDVRLERAVARDGEASRRTWEKLWMPREDRYVARDDPVHAAHVVVDGG